MTAHLATAQSGTATLQGKVIDTQKMALPGANVTIANPATGLSRTTQSDSSGSFTFPGMPPGIYALTVEMQGFKTSVVEKVTLQVDTTNEVSVGLQIGSLSESVQVTSEAPVINSTDASIGNVMAGSQIRALPLEGRNVAALLSLQPGVTYVPKADPGATMDPRYGSVSGARADQSTVTLDGIDVNDADKQSAFTSVLRVTLDSVQEFRVTTSNYGADQGRSSGAQVSMVTRSGTNKLAGAGYYVNRNTAFSSNEYFLKLSQLANGEPSKAPKLDKNIFGFSVGGPVRKDKLFFFGNFEGLNESRETVVTRAVPSNSLRDGVLVYQCATASACPGGTVQGLTGSHPIPAGSYGLTPAELRRIDPLHVGASAAATAYFRQFPSSNQDGRYPGNIDDFRFAAPIENTFRTYIARADYRLNGSHNFFGRFNKQNDAIDSAPQYPGQDPGRTRTDKNWGGAMGWDSTLGGNIVNTFRYGFTRIDTDTIGLRNQDFTGFRFIDDLAFDDGLDFSNGRDIKTHNFVDDMSMVKGRHTLKFGGNMRIIRNDNYTFENSFTSGTANASWTSGVGRRFRPGGACPAPADCSGLPTVASGGLSSYADSIIPLLGIISQTNVVYNYTVDGRVLDPGAAVERLYGANEFELYVQDSWHVRDNLTVSAGVRYGLYSPPWEVNGQQVAPTVNLGEWFDQRAANMRAGIASSASERITFVPGGPVNDGPGFYSWDKNNFAPRVSAAWTPSPSWVVRGGYGIVYDRIGAGLASTFDNGGSFGLSNNLSSPFGGFGETSAAVRFTNTNTVPVTYPDAPPAGFPATPEVGQGVITSSIDQSVRTPYSHVFNFIVGKELGASYGIEAGYVGRRGKNLLVRRDMAMPLNLTDPASGVDYFTAARQLVDAYTAAGGDVSQIGRIPYWENLFPDAAFDGLTATQNMAAEFGGNAPDYITALYNADEGCFPACSRFGPFSYFAEQYDSLAAQSSIGYSDYDALQLTLRRRYKNGYQFDLNYTLARGRDNGSELERGSAFDNFGSGGYSGFLVNSFQPDLNYSYSDFDVRHQINVNWLAELPFGQGKKFGGSAGTITNAIIGDWSIAGIGRWSSGFPFNVINCRSCWATNWNLQGNAALAQPGVLPETRTTRDAVTGQPSPFADPQAALEAFRNLYPGEAGIRNLLRGDGYYAIDLSIGKVFKLPTTQRLEFRWDIFNVTNTPKFDTGDVTMFPDSAASFGRYDSSLAACDGAAGRCMQMNLRYSF
ncbi:MAG: TonB-dependent receptor [Vicinamibacteraceae bacterium]